MVAQWLTIVGGICMALFPPLAYSDQYISICRKRSSTGFSTDIPGLLIVANVTRCFFWLGKRFQIYLLIQSILMIFAQFGILYVCLLYKDRDPNSTTSSRRRPLDLWDWQSFPPYLEFTGLLILLHSTLFLFLHKVEFYIELLGFLALGLEATLPIPQLLINFENKSTAGFRHTVLLGWFLGDSFKTIYYFATSDNGLAFKLCAVFQLSVDCCLLIQTFMYRKQTKLDLETREKSSLFNNNNDQLQHDIEEEEEAGVAGPESLLNTFQSNKNRRTMMGQSSETVFELDNDQDESDDDDDDHTRVSRLGRQGAKH